MSQALAVSPSGQLIREAVARHGRGPDALVSILRDLNVHLGVLSSPTLQLVAEELRLPVSRVHGVATFYTLFNTRPVGRHVVRFCESAPCHVEGGREVWLALRERLNLAPGETSPDGTWTLLTTSCLGVCAVGPVMMVDQDVYGNLTPEEVPQILERYVHQG